MTLFHLTGMHGDVVWNNFNAYATHENCLQSNKYIQPNSNNERIITDKQFAGKPEREKYMMKIKKNILKDI
jgi:hypothetical protein